MKFKVTLRNKLTSQIETQIIEANTDTEARYEANDTPNCQILSIRPLRIIGDKTPKTTKPVYVSIKKLRARHERDLCNQKMHLGRYSPEAIAAEQAKLQKELDAEMGN